MLQVLRGATAKVIENQTMSEQNELVPPAQLVRRVEQAIDSAINFKGMSAGSPKVQLTVSDAQYLLKAATRTPSPSLDEARLLKLANKVAVWVSGDPDDGWDFKTTENAIQILEGLFEVAQKVLNERNRLRDKPSLDDAIDGWLPIESAPKDGRIMLGGEGRSAEGEWWPIDKMWSVDFEPTHWQPLPAPPLQKEQEKK